MDYYRDVNDFKEQCGYTIDDVWYPRVTKIIGIKAKPALYHYYAQAKDYATAVKQTEASAAEGTLVHEVAEKIMLGENPEVPESIAPAIKAFKEFMDTKNIQIDPSHIEARLHNKEHRYAGTIDAIALMDGKFGVMDIKTSMDFYRDYNLQTAAYMDALIRDPLLSGLNTRWILRIDQLKTCHQCGATLRPKGGRDKIRNTRRGFSCEEGAHDWSELQGVVATKEDPFWKNDFQAFLGAKKLWEWENTYWLKKIGYDQ